MDPHSGEGDSGQKRRLADEPAFQKLRRLLGTMPADRQDAAIDHLKHNDDATTEETEDAQRSDTAGNRDLREDALPDQPGNGD